MVTQFSETGYAIGWGVHPSLEGMSLENAEIFVKEVLDRAIVACGVGLDDMQLVVPSGRNNGVAGKLRNRRGPKGDKLAYYPVWEMLVGWVRVQAAKDAGTLRLNDLTACLYAAENTLRKFA